MTGNLERARSAAEVATRTWCWICQLPLHRIIALHNDIEIRTYDIHLLPQRGVEMRGAQVYGAVDLVPRWNSRIEIPATGDGGARRLCLTGEHQVDVELLACTGAGACGRRIEHEDPSTDDLRRGQERGVMARNGQDGSEKGES